MLPDKPNRLFVPFFLSLSAFILYILFGHAVVQLAYERRALFLDAFVRYQHLFPAEYYFAKADDLMWRLAFFVCGFYLTYLVGLSIPYYFRPHLHLGFFLASALFFMRPWGHDWQFHLFRLNEAVLGFSGGQFPIYFSPSIANGKALPVFVFYSSWMCVPSFLLSQAGLGHLAALKLVLFMLALIAGTGMYFCLRRWAEPPGAALGTLLFVASGYFLGDVFVRFAFAEFHAYALLPWACLLLMRAIELQKMRHYIALAVVLSLMVIAHPFTALNTALGLACFGIVTAAAQFHRNGRLWLRLFGKAASMGLLTVLLTAFYWIPMAIEGKYVLQETALPVHYRDTFLTIRDYLSFFNFTNVGLPLSVAIVTAFWGSWNRKEEKAGCGPFVLAAGGVFLLHFFFTLRVSDVVWDVFSWLQKGQFVWRMLLPMTFFGTLFVGWRLFSSAGGVNEKLFRWASSLLILNALIFVILNAGGAILVQENPEDATHVLVPYIKEESWGVGEFRPNPATIPVVPGGEILGTVKAVKTEPKGDVTVYTIDPVIDAGYYRLERFWHVRYRLFADGAEARLRASPSGEIVLWLEGKETELSLVTVKPGYVVYPEVGSGISWILVSVGLIACHAMHLRSRCDAAAERRAS